MSSEIRKILELADQAENTQSQNQPREKQVPPFEKVPAHPLLHAPGSHEAEFPRFIDSHIIQVRANYPFSDCAQVLQIYTPIADPPDELRARFEEQIALLQPPVFPALSEERYYEHLCAEQLNPRVTYEQLVEVVDAAARYGFNFIVVADRLKRRALDPVVCLNVFMVYCEIQTRRRAAFDVQKPARDAFAKAMQTLEYYSKMLPSYDTKCGDELDREQTVRETWACFSPMRIAQRRFAVANALLNKKIPHIAYFPPRFTDFTPLCAETQQKPQRARATSYSVGQGSQNQQNALGGQNTENSANQQLSYKQQLLKTQITFNNVPIDEMTQPDPSLTHEQAIDFACEQIDAEQFYTIEPHEEEIDRIMRYYDSYIGKVDSIIDGFAYEPSLKLGNAQRAVPRGYLQIMPAQMAELKKETFPGHYELDFANQEVANSCTSASWRWCTEKISTDAQIDAAKVFEEDEKFDQKQNEAKFRKGQQLRKKLAGKEITVAEFFALEELYGDGFR